MQGRRLLVELEVIGMQTAISWDLTRGLSSLELEINDEWLTRDVSSHSR